MDEYKDKFDSVEEEFQYYALKALRCEKVQNKEGYYIYLKRASDLLEVLDQFKEEEKED